MKERRGGRVDGAREEHEAFGEDVRGEAEDGVPVNAGVLEVDAGSTVGADNDLKLPRGVSRNGGHKHLERHTLSYHRFVQVPTCTPFLRL